MKREQKKLEKQNKYKFGDNITKIEVKKTPKGEKTIISPINSNKQLEKSPI
jgi:hypothetical protein